MSLCMALKSSMLFSWLTICVASWFSSWSCIAYSPVRGIISSYTFSGKGSMSKADMSQTITFSPVINTYILIVPSLHHYSYHLPFVHYTVPNTPCNQVFVFAIGTFVQNRSITDNRHQISSRYRL